MQSGRLGPFISFALSICQLAPNEVSVSSTAQHGEDDPTEFNCMKNAAAQGLRCRAGVFYASGESQRHSEVRE